MAVTRGPAVVRRRLGRALKQLRVQRRRQLGEIAKLLEISASKLSRIETGQVEPKYRDIRDLLHIYEASETEQDRMLGWANDAKSEGWWEPLTSRPTGVDIDMLISLEAEARQKRMYAIPVAGLVQTEAYARLLLSRVFSDRGAADVERMVQIRMGRQQVIEPDRADAPPLDLHLLLDEVALYRCSDQEVLRGQVTELLRRSGQDNVTLQILPFAAGWTGATSTFSIFDPREADVDWRVVNVEGTASDTFIDTPQAVSDYEEVWEELLGLALDPGESICVLQRALDR